MTTKKLITVFKSKHNACSSEMGPSASRGLEHSDDKEDRHGDFVLEKDASGRIAHLFNFSRQLQPATASWDAPGTPAAGQCNIQSQA